VVATATAQAGVTFMGDFQESGNGQAGPARSLNPTVSTRRGHPLTLHAIKRNGPAGASPSEVFAPMSARFP
jgi:hypothetical protein